MFDVAAYIASGTIEACLLGQCSPGELAELERLASLHPEIASEVAEIRMALEAFEVAHAEAAAMPPPPALKARILAAAEAAVATPPPLPQSPPAPIRPKASPWPTVLAVAALLACFASTYLFVQESRARESIATQLAELRANYLALTHESDSLGLALLDLSDEYDALAQRCSRAISLKGLPAAPNCAAFVYWNEQDGAVMARVDILPPAPPGKAYQLWAIVDGKPFDLGMLPMQGDSLPLMRIPKPVHGATAFAVTLEKESGVTQPEGEMYLMGKV
jgi:anti-sigma-K factor RskA